VELRSEIESWDPRFKLISDFPIFRKMKKGLPAFKRIGTIIADLPRIMSMVHI
jgi:hypothetical protein